MAEFDGSGADGDPSGTPGGDQGSLPLGVVDWSRRFESRLLVGDRVGAVQVLEATRSAGIDPIALYVDVVAPAMASIGDRWSIREIDVAVEHRASVIAAQTLAVIGTRIVREGPSRGTVVLGAAPGERHSLPVRVVAEVLRVVGFEVDDLGADVPSASFAAVVGRTEGLVAVGVSTTMFDDVGARSAVSAIRQVVSVPVFLGGRGVPSVESARRLGADQWAPDARVAGELMGELADSLR